VHSALLCCVRTGLIINLNFLEERVGESPHPPMYLDHRFESRQS
jgi:hypothetical protein